MHSPITKLTLIALTASSMAMAACSQEPEPTEKTVGQKIDATIADVKSGVADAKTEAHQMADDAKHATTEADTAVADTMNEAGQALSDTGITAKVKAKLVAEGALDGADIEVSTTSGRVTLAGTVANEAARALATELTQGVDGVAAVDNQLELKS